MVMKSFQEEIREGIPSELPNGLAEDPRISRAPKRRLVLSRDEQALALQNALRYFPEAVHETLAEEFLYELQTYGRIYMLRFRPSHPIHARPIADYPAKTPQAAAIMLMIQNNLDPAVAQHPYELVTYGGNGSVFQNWGQYRLVMKYLSEMTESQTLVMYSGHPLGLFPSHPDAPRVVVTNGMMIPNYSSVDDYERYNALGVTNYGQMTAGSYMYIGPQGIVHGTTITLLGAGRLYLGLEADADLAGKVFVTSGLGGMSGAQPKAAVIAGAVCVVAEINDDAARKRHDQGWVDELYTDLDRVIERMCEARDAKQAVSIAYVGNVVDLWERLAADNIHVDLGSDQTSLHLPSAGGYYPVGMTLHQSNRLMTDNPARFKKQIHASLKRQVTAINTLAQQGMRFWDYGNAFLL
jgi:urocanate hydratase